MQDPYRRNSEVSGYLIELQCLQDKKSDPNTDCECKDYLDKRITTVNGKFGAL